MTCSGPFKEFTIENEKDTDLKKTLMRELIEID